MSGGSGVGSGVGDGGSGVLIRSPCPVARIATRAQVRIYGSPVRVLWQKAPFALIRQPALLASVFAASVLIGLAAATAPVLRSGIESESLHAQLEAMSPLAAGLEVTTAVHGAPAPAPPAARIGAGAVLDPAVVTDEASVVVGGADGAGVQLVAMARTGALSHVERLTPRGPPGVWISSTTALVTHLRPGGTLRLTEYAALGRQPGIVGLRVAGVYRTLQEDLGNPFWQNFIQEIRSVDPNAPPPPAFVLMTRAAFERVARRLTPTYTRHFEYGIGSRTVSLPEAERLQGQFLSIRRRLQTRGDPLTAAFGCRPICSSTSSLGDALSVARADVADVGSTVSLVSWVAIVIALATAFGVGTFLVRRRIGEVRFLYNRGEHPGAFAVRTMLEALLPAAVGVTTGAACALLALRELAPTGVVDGATERLAGGHAALGGLAALITIAVGAAAAFPRRSSMRRGRVLLVRIPWELVPLVGAAFLAVELATGRGLVHDANGGAHPALLTFLLPILAATAAAGIGARLLRHIVSRAPARRPTPIFLAQRRVGSARGLLVAVIVSGAASFGALAFAETLSASVHRSAAEKAFIANGGDVQAVVDPTSRILEPLGFPAAIVELDSANATETASGGSLTLVAGDPRAIARSLANDTLRAPLERLAAAGDGTRMPILAVGLPESTRSGIKASAFPSTSSREQPRFPEVPRGRRWQSSREPGCGALSCTPAASTRAPARPGCCGPREIRARSRRRWRARTSTPRTRPGSDRCCRAPPSPRARAPTRCSAGSASPPVCFRSLHCSSTSRHGRGRSGLRARSHAGWARPFTRRLPHSRSRRASSLGSHVSPAAWRLQPQAGFSCDMWIRSRATRRPPCSSFPGRCSPSRFLPASLRER